jgi:hypothetical protein
MRGLTAARRAANHAHDTALSSRWTQQHTPARTSQANPAAAAEGGRTELGPLLVEDAVAALLAADDVLDRDGVLRAAVAAGVLDLGFGRIVASAIEAPDMFAIPV